MLAPGTTLGPYTVTGLLGVGGMGEVYRAHDSRLEREVAIKVLPSEFANDASSLERFRRETRAVAALSHPNILAIFDVGSEDGVHYAVTELLEGETLRSRFGSGAFTPRAALETMLQIADGVAAAHARGIVHRDLKPENIFITTSGLVKVLDFGLARGGTGPLPGTNSPTVILPTEPGMVLGTIGYAAPEQLEARGVTPATDVFALGCVLFEMIAGRLPFDRASAISQMVALLHEPAPRLDESNDALRGSADDIVQRCLPKTPAERFQNAGELAAAIRDALAGYRTTARISVRPRRRTIVAAIVIAAILGIAAASFALYRARNRQIDHGYDLRVSDIRGDSETQRLVELALRADAEGNRPKAMQLFEEAWRRPAKTAIPAAFLSSFADAAGHNDLGRDWGQKALSRLDASAPVYESLLARYLLTPSMQRNQELALSKSALEIRPQAWRLRLAAAHILLGQRDREAARRELLGIDITKVDDRRLMLVLADRASLGDADGAARDLRSSNLMKRPSLRDYVLARIAWSRGKFEESANLYDLASRAAADEGHGTIEVDSRLYSGIALLKLGRFDDAQRRFAITAARARQLGNSVRLFDASAFAAYTAWRAGDDDLRDRRLAEAASVTPPPAPWAALRLLAIRMGSDSWKLWSTEPVEKEPLLQPAMSVIRGREALAAGDVEGAKRELRRARAEGVDESETREEAELLAAELGLPFEVLPADPPYPNVLRYMAIFDAEARRR